ncbi:hypothetical protein CUS60_13315 [Enterococcus faecium]|nr:hypothetical protein CUS60_13315 [Enterococcus faecium]
MGRAVKNEKDKPNEKNTVDEIKSWLTKNNINFNGITLKSDLLNLVNNVQVKSIILCKILYNVLPVSH